MGRHFAHGVTVFFLCAGGLCADETVPTVKVGGRLMCDAAGYHSPDVDLSQGSEVRRARVFAKGKVDEAWSYKVEYDLTGSGAEGIRDAYLRSTAVPAVAGVTVGNFSEFASLEDTTSSKYITFMERSLPILAFAPAARRIGAGADAHGAGWYAGAGVFGEGVEVDNRQDDGVGASARGVWLPVHAERALVHLGISGAVRTPRGDGTARFRAQPEAHVDPTRFVDTGIISNVNHTALAGLEAACTWGPVCLEAEHLITALARDGAADELYDGAYLTASWFLTGETRPYDVSGGCFDRVVPARPLGQGGWGALAVAARASRVDLDDGIPGGKEDNYSAGLDWRPSARTRFMLNYVNANAHRNGTETVADIVQARAQVEF